MSREIDKHITRYNEIFRNFSFSLWYVTYKHRNETLHQLETCNEESPVSVTMKMLLFCILYRCTRSAPVKGTPKSFTSRKKIVLQVLSALLVFFKCGGSTIDLNDYRTWVFDLKNDKKWTYF